MENKTHSIITIHKNNRYQAFPMFEVLLIEDEGELKVKLPYELEYTRVHFIKSPQEGDSTTPCADGSIWRYENKKWTRWIEDRIKKTAIERREAIKREVKESIKREVKESIKREVEESIKREVEESIKRGREKKDLERKKDFIDFIYVSVILALAVIGLITVLSRLF